MNVSTLLSEFVGRGIALWEDSGRIRYSAPRGAMTSDLLEGLRSHKEKVLGHLRQLDADAYDATDGAELWCDEPEDREEPFPLTEVQTAYLMGRGDMFAYGGAPCQIYLELPLPADTDPDRLAAAWEAVLAYFPPGQRARTHGQAARAVHADGGRSTTPDEELSVVTRMLTAAREGSDRTHDSTLRHLAGPPSARLPPLPPDGEVVAELSAAEYRVGVLAARGFTNRQIASRLYITISTVEQHLTQVYRKLKVKGRADLPVHLRTDGAQPADRTAAGVAPRPP